jgi:predicted nucleic acid-binding protein
LTLVPPVTDGAELYDLGRGPESTGQRVKRLQEEARLLAREEIERLDRDLRRLAGQAEEIAKGGEAYPAGIRELAGRISADSAQRAQMLRALLERKL